MKIRLLINLSSNASHILAVKYLFFLVFLLLVGNFSVQAQGNEINFKTISLDEGLSDKNVYSILQDRKGFIWFGTKNGLNVFDGYSIKEYKNNPADKESLSSNYIQVLYEDSQGYIWAGTYDGGLNRLDSYTGKCKVYSYDPLNPKGISSNNIYAIHEDKAGNLWIGTYGGGLCKLDRKTDSFKVYSNEDTYSLSLSSNNVFSIVEDEEGALWLGTFGGGLCKFLPKEEIFTVYKQNPANPSSIPSNDIYALHQDKQGNIWIGTYGKGLGKFNKKTGQCKTYNSRPEDPKTINCNYIFAIQEDELGTIWVGTKTGGLNRFKPETEEFTGYFHNPFKLNSIPVNTVNGLFLDKSGVLWIATDGGGVCRFETQNMVFNTFVSNPNEPEGFIADAVTSIFEDKEQTVWIGTISNGLYSYEKNTNLYTSYRSIFNTINNLVPDYTISAICEDDADGIWIGTADNGLFRLNKKTKHITAYESDPFSARTISSNGIETLFKDSKGQIWIGTYDGGLCRFNAQTNTFSCFQNDPGEPGSLGSNTVKIIYEDKKGTLWIGTKDAGLAKLNLETETFTNYIVNKNSPNSLTSNNITSIVEELGILWIGTFDKGICKFDREDEVFIPLTVKNGLPENTICGLLTDNTGNIWVSTTKGLVRYNPGLNRFRTFTVDEGLYSNEFHQWSYFKNRKGEMYFGGANHYIQFDPAKVLDNAYKAPIYLTGFILFDKAVDFGRPLYEKKRIELNYNDNFFEFEFALLHFGATEKNQYLYKMEGVDKEWKMIGNRRMASYTNLDANEYVFRVKAADKYGVWTEPGASIAIIIHPAWYNTWLFRMLVVLIVVGLSWAYYRNRIQSVERQKHVLESLVIERTAELVHKNEEIEAQKESIEEKNESLVEAKLIIEEQNEELKAINNQLEQRVEERTSELRYANQNLIKSNQELDMFIYRASHDIKGPVATLSGLCKVAAMDVKDAKAQEYFHLLDQTCDKTTRTLIRILSIYEIRNAVVDPEYIVLQQLILAIYESIRQVKDYDKIQFELDCPANLMVYLDATLLHTILFNMIENAFRYSKGKDHSFVQVKVWDESVNEFRVQVWDNGIGIPEVVWSKLFMMFFKGTLNTSGTGLGLYISKIAAERMGGQISHQAQFTEKTVFELILPKVLNNPNEVAPEEKVHQE